MYSDHQMGVFVVVTCTLQVTSERRREISMQFPHFIIDLTQVKPYWTTFSSPSSVVGSCSYSAKYRGLVSQVATKQQSPAVTCFDVLLDRICRHLCLLTCTGL